MPGVYLDDTDAAIAFGPHMPEPPLTVAALRSRVAHLEHDLQESMRAVLHHFGPAGAKLVSDHVIASRKLQNEDH